MAKYISCADTAKIVRKALKENFKSIKFAVRSSHGASIHVEWTDGPIRKDVEAVVKRFEGAKFDGMTDSKSYNDSEYEGEEVTFGADYVMCTRNYTRVFIEAIVTQYCAYTGNNKKMFEITGDEKRAWISMTVYDSSEEHWIKDLISNTDGKDMHRAYEAQKERKQAEHDAYIRDEPKRKQQAEAARKKQEQEEKARQERRKEHTYANARVFYTTSKARALATLGLPSNASRDDVLSAFREKVKSAADGRGGYTVDMDQLTRAKEEALQ